MVRPDLEKFTFAGQEAVTLTISEPTDTLTLHCLVCRPLHSALPSLAHTQHERTLVWGVWVVVCHGCQGLKTTRPF